MQGFEVKILQAEENAMQQMMAKTFEDVVKSMHPHFYIEEEVLTVEEAADYLKMSRSGLDKLVREGKVKPHRLGQAPRFLKSELTELIKRS